MVTTCTCRLAAWIHPGKEARVGGPHHASRDMEAGTSSRVGQVGGDGPSCSGTVGTELSSWVGEIPAGDHDDPGHGWGYHAQDWRRRIDGRPSDGGSVLGGISSVDDSLTACCGRRGGGVRTTAGMASVVVWKG